MRREIKAAVELQLQYFYSEFWGEFQGIPAGGSVLI